MAFGYVKVCQCCHEVIVEFIFECLYFISSGLLISFPFREGFQKCVVWCPRIPGSSAWLENDSYRNYLGLDLQILW